MLSPVEISEYITSRLEKSGIRHQVSSFDSGCKMIDIWTNDQFYCVQLEEGVVGISLVTEEIDFSTIPDRCFQNFDEFKHEFENIIR